MDTMERAEVTKPPQRRRNGPLIAAATFALAIIVASDWFAEDGVQVTLRGEGIRIPDTRPEVVVTVQETADSEPVEFVMDSAASAGGTG